MYKLSEIISSFKDCMIKNNVVTDAPIIPDGELHRIHIKGDKPNTINGWYVLYSDRIPCGKFGSWKTNTTHAWCNLSRSQMSHHEWIKHRKLMDEARHRQEAARREIHLEAATRAAKIWEAANTPNANHPYLLRKQISAFTARQSGDALLFSICDPQGQLWSLQFIYPDGKKVLLSGGAKKGNFIPIQGTLAAATILITEGAATAASVAQANPTSCVIAAVDANNLLHVACAVRRLYPNTTIIICADDDRLTPGNPGARLGKQAAIAANATLALPQWPVGAPDSLTDFNDLACWLKNKEASK